MVCCVLYWNYYTFLKAANSLFPFNFLPNQNLMMSNIFTNQTLNNMLAYQALLPKIAQQNTMFPEAGQFGQMTPVSSIDSTASGVNEQVGIHAEQVCDKKQSCNLFLCLSLALFIIFNKTTSIDFDRVYLTKAY